MPTYAYLAYHHVTCPDCGTDLQCAYAPEPCYITFQWGYCPHRAPDSVIYQMGDTIYWRPSRDGIVRGWTSFDGYSCNVGDPTIENIIVTDVGTDVAHFPKRCQACQQPIGGAAVEIRGGRICTVWAFRPGELKVSEFVDHYIIRDDGSLEAKSEWAFRTFDYSEDIEGIRKLK